MAQSFTRRSLLHAGVILPLLVLPGCATRLGDLGFGLEDAIRRLLTLSSQRAFARLLTDEGFFQDELVRVELPPQLGGNAVTAALAVALGTRAVQDRLLRLVNGAAREGAEAAAPVIYDSIRDLTITDALRLARGGPTAATDYLTQSIGDRIFGIMFPEVGQALGALDSGVVARVLRVTTGINFAGLQADVARKASNGIWNAIGREEAAIRANPEATGDPMLIGLLGLARRRG